MEVLEKRFPLLVCVGGLSAVIYSSTLKAGLLKTLPFSFGAASMAHTVGIFSLKTLYPET